MILDSKAGIRGVLIDCQTGQAIRWAFWADTETGQYRAYRLDPKVARRLGLALHTVTFGATTQLRFIPTKPARRPAVEGEVEDPIPPVLPGATRKGRGPRLIGAGIPRYPCDAYGCVRDGLFDTADEMLLPPGQQADGALCQRAMVVAEHHWCEWHYKWPQEVSPEGDTVRKLEVPTCPGWTSQ